MSAAKDKMKPIENPQVLNIEKLIEMLGCKKKPEMADKFIGKYEKSSLDPTLAKIKTALYEKNVKDLELHSHTIKGSSAYRMLTVVSWVQSGCSMSPWR